MRQHQVVAGLRVLAPQLGDLLTADFDLVQALAWLAAQVFLVGLLDAGGADVVVGTVALLLVAGRRPRPRSAPM